MNGNWRIDFPRDLKFIGTIFHYERKPHGFFAPETITALGPTLEAIYVSVSDTKTCFFKGLEKFPLIKQNFFMPAALPRH